MNIPLLIAVITGSGSNPDSGSSGSVNFASDWNNFWTSISGSLGGLTKVLGIIGLLLVVGSVLKWFWDRRRGNVGQGFQAHSHVVYTAVLGAILAAPDFMMQWILTLVDVIVNAISSIGNSL